MIFFIICVLFLTNLNLFSDSLNTYLVGWYLNPDEKISKSFLKLDDGYYKDSYSDYYDIFIQYSLYNREKDFKQKDPLDFQPLLKLPHKKHVIVSLPAYSTFSRNLFSFFNSDSNKVDILKYSKVFLVKNKKNFSLDENEVKKYISTFWDKNLPTYGVLKVKNLKKDERIILEIDSKKVFNLNSNSAVNIYFDIFGLSYKLLNENSYINIIFNISYEDRRFWFIVGNKNCSHLDKKYKNFIRTDFNLKKFSGDKKIKIKEEEKKRYILSIPFETKNDTLWKTFQFNLKDFLKDKLKIENYEVKGLKIILKDAYLGNFSFSYKNQKKLEELKYLIDKFSSLNDERILGFYVEDEIEAKSIINLDRWFFDYNSSLYKDNLLKKKEETTVFYVDMVSEYIKEKNLIPFILHSAQFYDYKNDDKLKMIMFDDTSLLLKSDFIMFDDYLYDRFFPKRFKKIYDFAKKNSKKILYVADAYLDVKYMDKPFEKLKWRFFAPYIMGANGTIFYAYYYNKTDTKEKFEKDFYKQKIGLFSKFLKETSLNKIENSKEFLIKNGDFERFSKIVKPNKDKIYFLFFSNNPDSSYPSTFEFFREDEDIDYLLSILKGKEYKISQVDFKYFEGDGRKGSPFKTFNRKDKDDLLKILNQNGFSTFQNRFDVKILLFE
ncbi:MAG: hypothetical protein XD76_1358 [candidate division TA06 bacterium 32_111]|uniref:Uncharacterized protein n=2 Tax=Bacteria candidate phyla TaxID=1783234 RepID=A0A101I1B8_UNCT6|nr:MAG: hypothetical protein XD76_1358 [candidate division TA06 bacterium 32_111]KUK86659.1 MAG: hypothetical protein XE03_1358 [candidate division TA06 bacterium 34_109]HAF08386.1 hypothetical protein [candidate division WOR-3 bacterium]HCP16604.1 hypothetical protein [candidate division WOR-3 bacterium]